MGYSFITIFRCLWLLTVLLLILIPLLGCYTVWFGQCYGRFGTACWRRIQRVAPKRLQHFPQSHGVTTVEHNGGSVTQLRRPASSQVFSVVLPNTCHVSSSERMMDQINWLHFWNKFDISEWLERCILELTVPCCPWGGGGVAHSASGPNLALPVWGREANVPGQDCVMLPHC